MKAEPGIVKTHAQIMLPATPQRTADSFLAEPTPMIEPVMVCVVDTGMPKPVARNSVIAPLAEAQNRGAESHRGGGDAEAEWGGNHGGGGVLGPPPRHKFTDPGFRDTGADDAADQCVRGAGGNPVVPRDQVPGRGTAKCAEYDVMIDDGRIDDALAYGGGDRKPEN